MKFYAIAVGKFSDKKQKKKNNDKTEKKAGEKVCRDKQLWMEIK